VEESKGGFTPPTESPGGAALASYGTSSWSKDWFLALLPTDTDRAQAMFTGLLVPLLSLN